MLYNSIIFITVFLPIAWIGWYTLQYFGQLRLAKLFVVGMSIWFYGYFHVSYVAILLGSAAFNYTIHALQNWGRRRTGKKSETLLIIGVSCNVLLLLYFKYLNFFVDNLNAATGMDLQVRKILLPLGISFFTFQQIGFMVDTYREDIHYDLVDYLFYVTFFPQLVAGPIVTHDEFIPQIQECKKPTADKMYDGIALFILGLSKKVLLADSLAVLVNAEYDNITWLDIPSAWITIIFYMWELYFDFSGYSDMSIGLGKMFGIDLPQNFNSPFKADSVKDFWRRWHITLSRFLMKYIYIPLGGNRRGEVRKCLNLMIVFAISGVWHGANWTFILWGLMHGFMVVLETIFEKYRIKNRRIKQALTFILVTLSFSIFRADSLTDAKILWSRLFAGGFQGRWIGVTNTLVLTENYALGKLIEALRLPLANAMYIGTFLMLSILSLVFIKGKRAPEWIVTNENKKWSAPVLAILFVWSFVSLSKVSVFLYFNF